MSDERPDPPSVDPWLGRVVEGRYRVLRALGGGGMGSVYEAEHVELEKRVALKVIRPELVADDEIRARFLREAKATAKIEHPHVITAMDFGTLPDGGAFLVTTLVRGISLRERLSGGAMSWREACAIGAQIADALAAIHTRGFVHRDLTPDNVLLGKRDDGSPWVHVLDLGVVGVLHEAGDRRLTAEGHIVGTTGYMAPEQALGQATDARADLYALGVLLWEMCAGRPLYRERELTKVVAAQLTDPPAPPTPPTGEIPGQLGAMIRGLLEPTAARRPESAAHVRDELTSLRALPRSFVRPAGSSRGATRWVIPAAVGAALTLLATGVVLTLALGGDEPRVATAVPAPPAPPTPTVSAAPRAEPLAEPERSLFDVVATGPYRDARRRAAAQLLERPTPIPAGVRAAADLELARNCRDRRDALQRITAARDPRAAPIVARYREAPREGCGRGGQNDCYRCIRESLDLAWSAIR
ncbi:MAG TPA: hypothetical protein DEF51_02500 [Myxococcales bacterium]|nr:hypothetical protein [Myxococcales bacterium]